MPTNFHLAPAPKVLPGGITAVPMDIEHLDATFDIDAGAHAATATASLRFVSGPVAGNPIFDLRQTITDVRLDGASLGAAAAPSRDFGGGPGAELRVLNTSVAPGTTHTLEVDYAVGPPQSPAGGSYGPAIEYLPGPATRLSFGFTDLAPARYLESWVPCNLIFDQFTFRLVLRVTGTDVPHTVVTNGAVTTLGPNLCQVDWPATTTALSPLVELHPTSALSHSSAAVALPNGSVTVHAWKPAAGPANLATELGRLATWLTENAAAIGPYVHGDRFVAYLHVGGMEYDGGTTSSSGALRHEAHHSWWGRAVRPAGQPDGWIDEAWTTYYDNGGNGSEPFNFANPPITLCNRNPWSRVTPSASYGSGAAFFRGVASAMGVQGVKTAMADFYVGNRTRPVTTAALEEHLVARTGKPEAVDGFHRFVYGFGDQSPAPDLWLRDDPADTGAAPWSGRFWDSPDVWIRNADDGGTTHQNPEFGATNWFYARLRNRGKGTARHFVVTFAVASFAGMQFAYPSDWVPAVAAVVGFDLAPAQQRIVRARWPRHLVPAKGSHPCVLVSVRTSGDHPAVGAHTWEHNGLAQKNLTVVDLQPNTWFTLPFVVPGLLRSVPDVALELHRPREAAHLDARLVHMGLLGLRGSPIDDEPDSEHEAEPSTPPETDAAGAPVRLGRRLAVPFPPGEVSVIRLPPPAAQVTLGLSLRAPSRPAADTTVDLVLRERANRRQVLGGIALRVVSANDLHEPDDGRTAVVGDSASEGDDHDP